MFEVVFDRLRLLGRSSCCGCSCDSILFSLCEKDSNCFLLFLNVFSRFQFHLVVSNFLKVALGCCACRSCCLRC